MLTKKTPETIKASLKINAMGTEQELLLTYHNYAPDDFDAWRQNPENLKARDSAKTEQDMIRDMNATIVLHVVKSFDDGTDEAFPLNMDGLVELDRTWPGMLNGIMLGYHQARAATVQKN